MTIKMIATDIDGTLVNDDKRITLRTLKAIKKARQKGVYIVLCTGRPVAGVMEYLTQLNLKSSDDYAITFNGAQAMNVKTHTTLFENGIKYEECLKFLKLSKKFKIKSQIVTTTSKIFVTEKDISKYSIEDAFYTHMEIHYRPITELPHDLQGAKFMWVDDPLKIASAFPLISSTIRDNYAITLTAPWFLEFNNPLATKGHAVLELAHKLGIERNEIMAIGDENNDLSMLEQVGLGIAMYNGNARVKEIARIVTNDNNHDGVGIAIEKYVLGKK